MAAGEAALSSTASNVEDMMEEREAALPGLDVEAAANSLPAASPSFPQAATNGEPAEPTKGGAPYNLKLLPALK